MGHRGRCPAGGGPRRRAGDHGGLRLGREPRVRLQRHRRSRPHRPADDAPRRRRADRPVGGLHAGPGQRADRSAVGGGLGVRDDRAGGAAGGRRRWSPQRLAGDQGGTAVPGRHHRHPGALPRTGLGGARQRRGDGLPTGLRGLGRRHHDRPRHLPHLSGAALPRPGRGERGGAARHGAGPLALRDRRPGGGRLLRRYPGQADQAAALRRDRSLLRLRGCRLHPPLRKCPRGQRTRLRDARHRVRPARRHRLRRREGHALRRGRRCPADRPAEEPAHAQRHRQRGAGHRDRAAARGVRPDPRVIATVVERRHRRAANTPPPRSS